MATLPTLPLEIQNKIMIEHKGFNPYPFNKEYKWYVDICVEKVDDFIWSEVKNKSREWIHSQFEDENSFYSDEWGDLSSNILINISMSLYEDREE
jgi:hypothetical protein